MTSSLGARDKVRKVITIRMCTAESFFQLDSMLFKTSQTSASNSRQNSDEENSLWDTLRTSRKAEELESLLNYY